MKKIVLKYGLISGALAAVLMTATAWFVYKGKDPTKFENGELFGYTAILLCMTLVFLGIRAYREQVGEGRLTFGQGFQVGILIAIISSFCYALAWQWVEAWIMPDFMQQYMDASLAKMKASGLSAETIAQKTAEMQHFQEMYKNPLVSIALTFLEPFPVGLLVTLASAGILRKK